MAMLKAAAAVSCIGVLTAIGIAAATHQSPRWKAQSNGRSVKGACRPGHAFAGPPLSGPYCVGVETKLLIDRSREETLTRAAHDVREIEVHIFYPVLPGSDASPAQYGDPETWDPML